LTDDVRHEASASTAVAQQQTVGRLRLTEERRRNHAWVAETQVIVKIVRAHRTTKLRNNSEQNKNRICNLLLMMMLFVCRMTEGALDAVTPFIKVVNHKNMKNKNGNGHCSRNDVGSDDDDDDDDDRNEGERT